MTQEIHNGWFSNESSPNVRFQPQTGLNSDIAQCLLWGHKPIYAVQQGTQLFDDVVGESDERRRHIDAKRLGGREVECEAKERGLLEWQLRRLRSFENAINKSGDAREAFIQIWTI